MNASQYRTFVGVVEAYLRHEPHRFRDAEAWVLSHRPSAPEGATRQPRRYGYSGYRLGTFECMWNIAKEYRDLLHGPTAAPPTGLKIDKAEAFRVLLVAWLLSPRAALTALDWKTRPTGTGPMPLLDVEQVDRIESKYLLSASPRWKALVRAAWDLAGDPAYLDEPKKDTADAVVTKASEPLRRRRPKPCETRAYLSYLLIVHADASKLGRKHYSREQFDLVREHGSPAYDANNKCPKMFDTWGSYVRRGIAYFEADGDTSPSWSEIARILKLDAASIRTLLGTTRNF